MYHAQWSQTDQPWNSPGSTQLTGFSSTGAALSSPFEKVIISEDEVRFNLRTNLQGVVQYRVSIEFHPGVLLSSHVHLELRLILLLKRPAVEVF